MIPPAELLLVPAAAAAGAGLGLLSHGLFWPRSRVFCPVISSAGPGAGRRIALTFDDGPWPGTTDAILDTLERHRLHAAFFVIGRYARAHPELIRRIHAAGHLIANHTFDHSRLGLFRASPYWHDQITRTDDVIEHLTGERPRLFRPPMGFKSPPVARAARHAQHAVVTWSRRGYDGVATTPDRIVLALADTAPGDIVLLHDGRDPANRRDPNVTAAALPRVLDSLLARGLEPVRLDQLIPPPPPFRAAPTPAAPVRTR